MQVDLLVIGGGINGVGIARDAAGRGISVLLCEKDDLAAHTSSASTKLIHGGLRYLEHYAFGLVRKALQEREVLLRLAPHIARPLRFVVPHDASLRPMWMIRAGLFMYDHLARRNRLKASEALDLRVHETGVPLKRDYRAGFAYSDLWVEDARLVVLNVIDAAERGATIMTRTSCDSLERGAENWLARLVGADGVLTEVSARVVVNAAGPWVSSFLERSTPVRSKRAVRLIKGSHIVVRKLYDHAYAYLFQNPDGRIIFTIPFEDDFTLIGTTDLEYLGDPQKIEIDQAEIEYLCAMANRFLAGSITPQDVVWSYAGVRPLLEDESSDASAVTRDYTLDLDDSQAPILSVFGGKLTTFRKLGEEALAIVAPLLGKSPRPWTATAPLPGGDLPDGDLERFCAQFAQRFPWVPEATARRWCRSYGTRAGQLIGAATTLAELGEEPLPGLYAREIDYLIEHEWARTAEDILWRRTRLGLHLPSGAQAALDDWLKRERPIMVRR